MKSKPRWLFTFVMLLLSAEVRASLPSTKIIEDSHPLLTAIDQDRAEEVGQWMSSLGLIPNSKIKNKIKESLLDHAANHGSVRVCALMIHELKKNPDPKALYDSRGTPILIGLATMAQPDSPRRKQYESIVENLLQAFPENLQYKDKAYVGDGRTALHQAAASGNIRLMKILIQAGANVDAASSIGETPLHFASRFGHAESVKFLVRSGANINAQTKHTRSTPLMLASEMGQDSAIRALLILGARKDIKDAFGKTAVLRLKERRTDLVASAQTRDPARRAVELRSKRR